MNPRTPVVTRLVARARSRRAGFAAALAPWIGLGLESRSRLSIPREVHGSGFHFDEGRTALIALLVAILGLMALQAQLRRASRVRARGGSRARTPEPMVLERLGRSRDAVVPAAENRSSQRFDEPAILRCPRCYGKYNAEREVRCPHCGADRPGGVPEPPTGAVQGRAAAGDSRRDVAESAPTRFHDAERFNEEGVEILQKMRSAFRVDDAVKKFTLAISRAPKNPTYHSNRGVAHFANARRRFAAVGSLEDATLQRDLDKARADFAEAIRIKGGHTNYFLWRGQLEEFCGDLERARADFETALELDVENAAAHDALARLTQELEQSGVRLAREKTERWMADAAKRGAAGDLEGALGILDKVIDTDGPVAAALIAKADVLNRLNRIDESVEVARRAIDAQSREIQSLVASYQAKGVHASVLPSVGEGAELSLQARSRMDEPERRGAAVSGSLGELGLPDLLQVLGSGQKTVRVTLRREGHTGVVELENGHIVHSELEKLVGEEAFYRVVTWSDGEFRIDPLIEVVTRTINASNDALILEGLRRLDEALHEATAGGAQPQ